jgi:hypothetical protein
MQLMAICLATSLTGFRYVRFELKKRTVVGEMIRLGDSAAPAPGKWEVRDRFELTLPP